MKKPLKRFINKDNLSSKPDLINDCEIIRQGINIGHTEAFSYCLYKLDVLFKDRENMSRPIKNKDGKITQIIMIDMRKLGELFEDIKSMIE